MPRIAWLLSVSAVGALAPALMLTGPVCPTTLELYVRYGCQTATRLPFLLVWGVGIAVNLILASLWWIARPRGRVISPKSAAH